MEVDVAVGDQRLPALAYPALVGEPEVGDRVLVNAGAFALGLGSGGYGLVVALPDRLPPDPAGGLDRAKGHLVKARYTPLQAIVLGADEPASPHQEVLAGARDLGGMPVVAADLHSALPAILAGVHADLPDARVAYVMTDGAALPAWFSRTVDGLSGLLAGVAAVITVAASGSVNSSIGDDLLLPSFAAPIIGGVALAGGMVSVTGTLLAAFLVRLVDVMQAQFGINPRWIDLIIGAVVLGAVLLGTARQRIQERRSP